MTSTEQRVPTKVFATLRFAGDRLVPEQVTRILKVVPTQAFRKGERYSGGSRTPNLTGQTGMWYFCTDHVVAGNRLSDHLAFIERLLEGSPAMTQALRNLVARQSLQGTIGCFWHGGAGAKRPSIPRSLTILCASIPARIEIDFDTDEQHEQRAA